MTESAVGISYQAAYCYGLKSVTDYRCLDLANPGIIFWFISIVLVIFFVTILLFLVKALRNKKLPLSFKMIFSLLSLIFILALIFAEIWNLEHTSYRKIGGLWEEFETNTQLRRIDIPSYAIETANNLIIYRIGKERFSNDIRYNEDETRKVNVAKVLGNAKHQVYKIAYNFKPLEILNESSEDSLFYVDIVDKDSPYYSQHIVRRQGIVNNRLPDCVTNNSFCNFHFTAKDAIKIADDNGFGATDLKVKWYSLGYPMLTIELSSCIENKVMHLDYRDGSVIDFEDKVICGGVF